MALVAYTPDISPVNPLWDTLRCPPGRIRGARAAPAGRVEQYSVWVNLVNRHPPDDHWLVCQLHIAANTPTNAARLLCPSR